MAPTAAASKVKVYTIPVPLFSFTEVGDAATVNIGFAPPKLRLVNGTIDKSTFEA